MRNINKIRIFSNDNELSVNTKENLIELLKSNDFQIVDDNPDLAIAIGGDGAFLRMIKALKFNEDIIYIGVNTGTLGFLQEVKKEDLELFVHSLNNNRYKLDKVGIQETIILTEKEESKFNGLNEIVVREKELNTIIVQVLIDGACIEKYIGDGLLISTSIGSTAYNLSFGGSIVYNNLHTLQITPIAPLNNQVYRNLLNSVIIPEKTEILMKPLKKDLLISIDGENLIFEDVKEIKTCVRDKRLKFMRLETYNFYEKINEKFLTN